MLVYQRVYPHIHWLTYHLMMTSPKNLLGSHVIPVFDWFSLHLWCTIWLFNIAMENHHFL